MALLFDSRSQKSLLVEPELLVGRSPACGLCIAQPYVSARHAAVRWDGRRWELKDLGSRNGTFLNGMRLGLGQTQPLTRGALLAFGHEAELWELRDDGAPTVMVVPLDGSDVLCVEHDVLGIPSADDPQATIFRDLDGNWKLEGLDGDLTVLEPQQVFHAVGRAWRFSCPEVVGSTSSIGLIPISVPVRLVFSVSRDEEHVELRAIQGDGVFDLGSRNHNYLLLTLARARQEDAASGIPDAACGWVYQDDLLDALKTSPSQLNIDVFRIRQQFGKSGFREVINIVERRPRSKQLRIGVAALEILVL